MDRFFCFLAFGFFLAGCAGGGVGDGGEVGDGGGAGVPQEPAAEAGDFASLEERAAAALAVARREGLREDCCLLLDYAMPSGEPRLMVWSFEEGRVVACTFAMHGPGPEPGGPQGSTKEHALLGQELGSRCSAAGLMALTHEHGTRVRRSYRLRGLEERTRNVWDRGLMVHAAPWMDMQCFKEYVPLHERSCEGCVTLTGPGMALMEELMEGQEGELLLWAFEGR